MALQRNLKALGTFGYQTTTRGNPVYIQYMPRTLAYARTTTSRSTRASRACASCWPTHVDELPSGRPIAVQSVDPCQAPVRGVSTHLYHGTSGSTRDHLLEIAAHGFEAVELFATRTHFDYHNPPASPTCSSGWPRRGSSCTACTRRSRGLRRRPLGHAARSPAPTPTRGRSAVAETERALHIARRIPVRGARRRTWAFRGADRRRRASNSRDAARRSIEELPRLAEPLGVRIAVEVIPNELSRAGSLVHFVEEDLDAAPTSASASTSATRTMDGDLVDAIETVSDT